MLLLGFLFLVPETPRFLLAKNRPEEARRSWRVNGPAGCGAGLREISNAIADEGGALSDLFKPGARTVLLIGIALAVLQQVNGINVFLYYAPDIFKRGAHSDAALLQTVVVGAVNLLFTIVAIWTVDRLGRKPLMVLGWLGWASACWQSAWPGAARGPRSGAPLILGYIASRPGGWPVTWVILSGFFPTRIRGRSMAVATVCLWPANFIVSQTFPMMDQNPWLLAGFIMAFPSSSTPRSA